MKMVKVQSSNIAEIGHAGHMLKVKFHKGGIYTYTPVAPDLFILLRDAESVTKFFNEHIKEDPNLHVNKIA